MKVAVTGARGGVGRNTVPILLERGYEVRAVNRTPWADCPCEQLTGVNLMDFDAVMEAFRGCDRVVHIANIPGPLDDNRPETFVNNMTCNYNVLLAAGLLGIPRVVITGSVCVMGYTYSHHFPDPPYLPLDEEVPPMPDDSYGISKLLTDRLAERMVQRFPFMSVASLRISRTYLPEEYAKFLDGDLKRFLQGDGPWVHNMASYVDARDVGRAHCLAMEADFTGAEAFYICNPDSTSTLPTMDYVRRRFPNVPLKRPLGEFECLEDSSKARRMLGWVPEYNWRDEMKKAAQEKGVQLDLNA